MTDILGTIVAVVVLVGFGYFVYRKLTAKKSSVAGGSGGAGGGNNTHTDKN